MPSIPLDVAKALRYAHIPDIEYLNAVNLLYFGQRLTGGTDSHPVKQQRTATNANSFHSLVHADGIPVKVARCPELQSLLEETVLQEVVAIRHVVSCFIIERAETSQSHLNPCFQVFASLMIEELTDGIKVV